MATNYPGSLDDTTSMPTRATGDAVAHSDNNDKTDAIVALETKVGTGSSAATSGKFLKGSGTGTSAWANIAESDVTNLTTDLAAKVPTTTTVNGHALSSNVTVTASDVSAVPTTRTVNGHALSANVTVTADDVLPTQTGNSGKFLTTDGSTSSWGTPSGGGGGAAKPKVQFVLADGANDPTAASGAGIAHNTTGGSIVWGQAHGSQLITTTTLNSSTTLFLNDPSIGVGSSYGYWGPIYDRTFTVMIQAGLSITSDSGIFLGMNDAFAVPGSSNKHVGFRCDSSGGGGATQTWYATNGTGSTATTTDITTTLTAVAGYTSTNFYAVQNFVIEYSPTSIKYYFNGTLCATHTTNIPSGDNSGRPSTTMEAYLKNLEAGASSVVAVDRFVIDADAY